MGKIKVSPTRIVITGALQVVLTTVGFVLYKRPYLWALTAIEWYSKTYCGTLLDSVEQRYKSYDHDSRALVQASYMKYQADCAEDYLESFTDMFYEKCFFNAKAAFVSIPIVSTMLILGIILCLHWAPFRKDTLKKPAFMLALLLSLILVAVNFGQIITMIVPLINANATPDGVATNKLNQRVMKCGVGAETTALVLMIISSFLSVVLSYFIIRLYVMRIKGQKENLTEARLRIETLAEYEAEQKRKKKKSKNKLLEHQESVYHDANDASFGPQNPYPGQVQGHAKAASSPKSQIPFAGAQ